MNHDDYDNFLDAIDKTCAVIRKPAIDDSDVLDAWFAVLSKYSFTQVKAALSSLSVHPQSSFGITPALIIECMGIVEKSDLTWKGVISLARKPITPIGVLARIHIKSFNLNGEQDVNLHHLAQEFLDDLPEIKARALAGDYSEHEVSVMIERGVRPTAPFMDGMPEYKALGGDDPLRLTFEKAKKSDYIRVVNDRKESEVQNGLENIDGKRRAQAEMAKLFESDKPDTKQIDNTAALKADFDKQIKGVE